VLVIIGLGITLAGAAGLWATVLAEGTAVSVWAMAPSIFVLGVGMGACFSSIYDVAIVYFSQRAQHGAGHVMTVSVAVVAAIALAYLGLAWLLPRSAPQDQHG
jgi:hypothetical protein